jgi:hypothetical protein
MNSFKMSGETFLRIPGNKFAMKHIGYKWDKIVGEIKINKLIQILYSNNCQQIEKNREKNE